MFGAMVIANRSHAAYLALKSGLLSLKATVVLTKTVMQGGLGLSAISGTLGTVMRGFAAARTVIAGFGLSSLAALWPVVLAVAAVAAVAFVIYKYWKPLKAFFAGFWEGLTKGLEPLTPLFDAFVGTLNGIWTAVQPYLQPVLDWFGDFFNLTQAGEGNARSWGESVGSASDLQQRFTNHTSSLAASMAANSAELSAARQGAAAAGGITVHFSPTIHAPGGNPQQIEAALQMGLQEFETMFRRMMDDKARRAY